MQMSKGFETLFQCKPLRDLFNTCTFTLVINIVRWLDLANPTTIFELQCQF